MSETGAWSLHWASAVRRGPSQCYVCVLLAVIGRSIVVHAANRGAPRLACADILPADLAQSMLLTIASPQSRNKSVVPVELSLSLSLSLFLSLSVSLCNCLFYTSVAMCNI